MGTGNAGEIIIKVFANTCSGDELEALSTMDYIADSILPEDVSDEEIIAKYKEIKAEKFNECVIEQTLAELKELGLIAV